MESPSLCRPGGGRAPGPFDQLGRRLWLVPAVLPTTELI